MGKIYYLEELKKYGNAIGVPVPKKELTMIGQGHNWKKGTKVRVLIEILPDDFSEDTQVTRIFENKRTTSVFKDTQITKIKPSKKKAIKDPFSSANVEVFEDEIPDEPTKKSVKDSSLKGKGQETK